MRLRLKTFIGVAIVCILFVVWMAHEKFPREPIKPMPLPGIDPTEFRECSAIPQTMVFTYKHNIHKTKSPPQYYRNIERTIAEYRRAWGNPDAPVRFLADDDCRAVIGRVKPGLVEYFDREIKGMYKADMCRVAALYEEGGYYLDIDLEVITPVTLSSETCFTTVLMDNGVEFFQAFVAATSGHLILRQALHFMLEHYQGKHEVTGWMGTTTLKDAYDSVPVPNRGHVHLLGEADLTTGIYPSLKRRTAWGNCNYVVHDAHKQVPYFYSRIVASTNCGSFLSTTLTAVSARLPSNMVGFFARIMSTVSKLKH